MEDEIVSRVIFRGVSNGAFRTVNADHLLRNRCQKRTAVAVAAGNVQNNLSGAELQGKKVLMKALMAHFALRRGSELFPGELRAKLGHGESEQLPIGQSFPLGTCAPAHGRSKDHSLILAFVLCLLRSLESDERSLDARRGQHRAALFPLNGRLTS